MWFAELVEITHIGQNATRGVCVLERGSRSAEIEVEIKDQLHRVPEGASIHFKAAHPHTIFNPLNQASRVLWVVTPRLTVPLL